MYLNKCIALGYTKTVESYPYQVIASHVLTGTLIGAGIGLWGAEKTLQSLANRIGSDTEIAQAMSGLTRALSDQFKKMKWIAFKAALSVPVYMQGYYLFTGINNGCMSSVSQTEPSLTSTQTKLGEIGSINQTISKAPPADWTQYLYRTMNRTRA